MFIGFRTAITIMSDKTVSTILKSLSGQNDDLSIHTILDNFFEIFSRHLFKYFWFKIGQRCLDTDICTQVRYIDTLHVSTQV